MLLVYKLSSHKIKKAKFPAGRAWILNAQPSLQHHLFSNLILITDKKIVEGYLNL